MEDEREQVWQSLATPSSRAKCVSPDLRFSFRSMPCLLQYPTHDAELIGDREVAEEFNLGFFSSRS